MSWQHWVLIGFNLILPWFLLQTVDEPREPRTIADVGASVIFGWLVAALITWGQS